MKTRAEKKEEKHRETETRKGQHTSEPTSSRKDNIGSFGFATPSSYPLSWINTEPGDDSTHIRSPTLYPSVPHVWLMKFPSSLPISCGYLWHGSNGPTCLHVKAILNRCRECGSCQTSVGHFRREFLVKGKMSQLHNESSITWMS